MNTKKSFPLPPKENLNKSLIVRFTGTDFEKLSKLCKAQKITKSDLIRFFVHKLLNEQNNN